jgi:hypothetical protein
LMSDVVDLYTCNFGSIVSFVLFELAVIRFVHCCDSLAAFIFQSCLERRDVLRYHSRLHNTLSSDLNPDEIG